MNNLHSESIKEITAALVKVQGGLQSAKTTKFAGRDSKFSYRYADLAEVWSTCRKALAENGLAVTQLPCLTDTGHMQLRTMLLHISGEWLASDLKVEPAQPLDHKAVGSALTYARRYALAAIVGIAVEGEDDDADAASRPQVQRRPQREPIPSKPAQATPVPRATHNGESPLESLGAFLSWARKTYGYKTTAEIVTDLPGCVKPADIPNIFGSFDKAREALIAVKSPKAPEAPNNRLDMGEQEEPY